MKVRELPGWPPTRFQCVAAVTVYPPSSAVKLRLHVAAPIPGLGNRQGPEVMLILMDEETEDLCSTRIRLKSGREAACLAKALAKCRGQTLDEVGNVDFLHAG
jgi:hypothetical protein